MKLRFEQTSKCCPEQYDVFDENNKQVAYIRLRSWTLFVYCPECFDICIYTETMNNRDNFGSEEERNNYLKMINDKILEFYDKVEKKIDPEYSRYLNWKEMSKFDELFKENKKNDNSQ